MTLGTATLDLHIPGCRSLKEKRSVIRRLTARLRKDFNVSVAEVDKQDLHQSARIGVAFVCNDKAFANTVLSKLVESVDRESSCYLQDYSLEFL